MGLRSVRLLGFQQVDEGLGMTDQATNKVERGGGHGKDMLDDKVAAIGLCCWVTELGDDDGDKQLRQRGR